MKLFDVSTAANQSGSSEIMTAGQIPFGSATCILEHNSTGT